MAPVLSLIEIQARLVSRMMEVWACMSFPAIYLARRLWAGPPSSAVDSSPRLRVTELMPRKHAVRDDTLYL